MKINNLSIENFRNIENLCLSPCEGVNIIYGENGQGKTNIMEAIWLFTGDKSFRGAGDQNMINLYIKDNQRTFLQLDYQGENRDITSQITLSPAKKYMVNDISVKTRTGLFGRFYSVIFSPTHLGLIKDGPEERRLFLDRTICQIKPKYRQVLSDLSKVITQRNHMIKKLYNYKNPQDLMEVWDSHLARLSATVAKTRYTYLNRITPLAVDMYRGISGDGEALDISYKSKLFNSYEEIDSRLFKEKISANLAEDIKNGSSTLGAHRDDIEISLDGMNSRLFASQGQQRSIVLSLKLAEAAIIRETTGEDPVILLDDVMSELDVSRRSFLLNQLQWGQIFITCCDQKDFDGIVKGRAFEISKGSLKEVNQWYG